MPERVSSKRVKELLTAINEPWSVGSPTYAVMEGGRTVAHTSGDPPRARLVAAAPDLALDLLDARAEIAQLRRDLTQLVEQRDRAQDAANRLAYALYSEDDIGEHSNLNCPWANAAELLEAIAQSGTPSEAPDAS